MNTDKAILDEITRRVFELEGEQRHFDHHSEELQAHIAALAEVSRVPRHEIEAIAYALTHDQRIQPRGLRFWHPVAVILTMASVAGIWFFINRPPAQAPVVAPPKPPVATPPPQAPLPQEAIPASTPPQIAPPKPPALPLQVENLYVQRAALANVFSRVVVLKTYVAIYYAENGKHPENFKQLGMADEDMNDGEYIKQVKILPEGSLRVELTDFFGKGRFLTLTQHAIMGGTQIKWECFSNLAPEVLTIGYNGSSYCTQETP